MTSGAMAPNVQKHTCDRAHCRKEFGTAEELSAHVEAHPQLGVRSEAVRVKTNSETHAPSAASTLVTVILRSPSAWCMRATSSLTSIGVKTRLQICNVNEGASSF